MFQTMMAKQPGYQNSGYKLFEAGFASIGQLWRGPIGEWPEEDRKAALAAFQKGWESLQDEVADAQKHVSGVQRSKNERGEVCCGPAAEIP